MNRFNPKARSPKRKNFSHASCVKTVCFATGPLAEVVAGTSLLYTDHWHDSLKNCIDVYLEAALAANRRETIEAERSRLKVRRDLFLWTAGPG